LAKNSVTYFMDGPYLEPATCTLTTFVDYVDYKTSSCTTDTSVVHSKLDYCNSLFVSINSSQMKRLPTIQNAFAAQSRKLST